MDATFKALADPSRRRVLDVLYQRAGLSLGELCEHVDFTRQALSKHLKQLEAANLVVSRFHGRVKRHYLNPVPIQEISERWLAKYSAEQLAAVSALTHALENENEREA